MIESPDYQQILEKAVQKAIDGGFRAESVSKDIPFSYVVNKNTKELVLTGLSLERPFELIFNHQFAKALWGDTYRTINRKDVQHVHPTERGETIPHWKYHLQRMVIDSDPIAYLGRNI